MAQVEPLLMFRRMNHSIPPLGVPERSNFTCCIDLTNNQARLGFVVFHTIAVVQRLELPRW